MTAKLKALLGAVNDGTKELEAQAEELMPRFAQAMDAGRRNMGRMRAHVEAVEASVHAIEDWNNQISNGAPPLDDSTTSAVSPPGK